MKRATEVTTTRCTDNFSNRRAKTVSADVTHSCLPNSLAHLNANDYSFGQYSSWCTCSPTNVLVLFCFGRLSREKLFNGPKSDSYNCELNAIKHLQQATEYFEQHLLSFKVAKMWSEVDVVWPSIYF